MTYTVEKIVAAADNGDTVEFRISDHEDKLVATCGARSDADMVCRALNRSDEMDSLIVAGDKVAEQLRRRCSDNLQTGTGGAAVAYREWTIVRGRLR